MVSKELFDEVVGLSLFRNLTDEQLSAVLETARVAELPEMALVISSQQIESTVYLLLSGMVEVILDGETISTLKEKGEFFGEMSIIDFSARTAEVTAITPVRLLVLDLADLDSLEPGMRDDVLARFYRTFSEKLVRRLRAANEEIVRLRKTPGTKT